MIADAVRGYLLDPLLALAEPLLGQHADVAVAISLTLATCWLVARVSTPPED